MCFGADVMKTKGHQTLLCVWYEKPQTQPEHQELVAKGKRGVEGGGVGKSQSKEVARRSRLWS